MWDLVVVGAGPAGAAAALGALSERPDLKVLLLDRSDFPRDKSCGDGVAPQVLDVLETVGVHGLLDDLVPVPDLALRHGTDQVRRTMARPVYVVPRTVLDSRLVEAAVGAGAELRRSQVRTVQVRDDHVRLDDELDARVVVGADGAYSRLRDVAGLGPVRRRALAIRGYAPTTDDGLGLQTIVFGQTRQPSYAWSFDRGDGWSNIGYGELLGRRDPPTRPLLLAQLERLIPDASVGATSWRAHHLPLSSWRWQQPDGRILLAGDAAGLINPMTGEGIYYAVATGVLAGRAAARSLADEGAGAAAGRLHRTAVRGLLGTHLRHLSVVSRLLDLPVTVPTGIRAAATDQRFFDDLVEIGLARGLLTARAVRGLVTNLRR